MEIPVDEFDGKVVYGEKRKQEGSIFILLSFDPYDHLYSSTGIERSYRYISIDRSRLSSNGKTCSNIVLCLTQLSKYHRTILDTLISIVLFVLLWVVDNQAVGRFQSLKESREMKIHLTNLSFVYQSDRLTILLKMSCVRRRRRSDDDW